MAKIPRVPVENQITTLSMVKIATKFSPCTLAGVYVYTPHIHQFPFTQFPNSHFPFISFHSSQFSCFPSKKLPVQLPCFPKPCSSLDELLGFQYCLPSLQYYILKFSSTTLPFSRSLFPSHRDFSPFLSFLLSVKK